MSLSKILDLRAAGFLSLRAHVGLWLGHGPLPVSSAHHARRGIICYSVINAVLQQEVVSP